MSSRSMLMAHLPSSPVRLLESVGGASFDVLFDARRKNVISDVASNEVSVFSAANTGALVPISGSPFTTPTLNNHKMALGSQGSCLFVAGGGDPRVSAMQVARDGSLSNAPGSPVATTGQDVVVGAATTQQGNFAYFGGDNSIAGFSFDNRCSLSPIPGSPFLSGGPSPFGVTTEGSGKFPICSQHWRRKRKLIQHRTKWLPDVDRDIAAAATCLLFERPCRLPGDCGAASEPVEIVFNQEQDEKENN
jgi:hypothetical protein